MDGSRVAPPLLILMVLLSFGSVNAVLITPALPAIASYFSVSNELAYQLMLWFLLPYACVQLVYGPLANRYGRKPVIYGGILLQLFSCVLCVFSAYSHLYLLLIAGRFFSGLGAGVGLKMAFTVLADMVDPLRLARQLSYVTIAFAFVPAAAAALGGFVTLHWGWLSTFYILFLYGLVLIGLISMLPETHVQHDKNAFEKGHLLQAYSAQFRNRRLVTGALMMSSAPSFFMIFSTLAPFIAIDHFKMNSETYGTWNALPAIGFFLASLASLRFATPTREPRIIIGLGIVSALIGALLMLLFILLKMPPLLSLFIPTILSYFGGMLIFPSVSAFIMKDIEDKANGSAVINFIFLSVSAFMQLVIVFVPHGLLVMPTLFLLICLMMLILFKASFDH